MKFRLNNRSWEIIELSQEEMREKIKEYKYDGEPQSGKYFGLTYFDKSLIYIDKDLCLDQKKQTLRHELMHCYIGCYLFNNDKEYSEEDLCNISANSHDIIHEICKQFFKNKIS